MTIDRQALDETLVALRQRLLATRVPGGHWEGELSSSALSTATAAFALSRIDRQRFAGLIDRGLDWLADYPNADGGWGDTAVSRSNISTTLLCWAALTVAADPAKYQRVVVAAEGWLTRTAGSLAPESLVATLAARYGKDRTFSAPILAMCVLAGRLGPAERAWQYVPALPFELAACPHRWLKRLRLNVVSYALPALIAIGQTRHHFARPRGWFTRTLRNLLRGRTLDLLAQIQPASGGYLEATPLTSFVVMCLAAMGRADHPAVTRGAEFLAASVRPDGSWPIDTNLATWVTTLAINALAGDAAQPPSAGRRPNGGQPPPAVHSANVAQPPSAGHSANVAQPPSAVQSAGGRLPAAAQPPDNRGRLSSVSPAWELDESDRGQLRVWLLGCQHRVEHPYTHAAPGGWAWTDLSGGVPDADDTAGALLALRQLGPADRATLDAAAGGVRWLLDLQNRDGGLPTFCRGWGRLPFDRSAADLTAHALWAWAAWRRQLSPAVGNRIGEGIRRGLAFLTDRQRPDGGWVPLWFGNEADAAEANPTYGTARVVAALTALIGEGAKVTSMLQRGVRWLLAAQNTDGGWGGAGGLASSIEETSLAVDALARRLRIPWSDTEAVAAATARGANWLIERTGRGGCEELSPSPIGFYFAKLWYFERLYPLLFGAGALGRVQAWLAGHKR